MKLILHLIMWPILGGIELNLLTILNKYPDKDMHHVIAYAQSRNNGIDGYYPGQKNLQEKIATIPNVELIKRGTVDNVDINDLITLTLKLKPDVIHVTKEHDFPVVFALNLLLGTPIVPVLHQCPGRIFSEFFPVYQAMFNEYPHYQVGNYAGDRYLYDLKTLFPPIQNLPPFEAIPNCVDTSLFAPNTQNRKTIRAQYGISDNAFVIGSVGVLDVRKRQLWVIKALESILEKDPQADVYCMLIGQGELEKELKDYVAQKGLQKHIIFAGLQGEVAPYYNALDLYAHPASTEACPMAILEALASGLPIVMYSPQCPSDEHFKLYGIVQHGYNVHAVYENDSDAFTAGVFEVFNNEKYRKSLISYAQISAQEFSPESVAIMYHRIFTTASQRPRFHQREKFITLFNYYFPLSN